APWKERTPWSSGPARASEPMPGAAQLVVRPDEGETHRGITVLEPDRHLARSGRLIGLPPGLEGRAEEEMRRGILRPEPDLRLARGDRLAELPLDPGGHDPVPCPGLNAVPSSAIASARLPWFQRASPRRY